MPAHGVAANMVWPASPHDCGHAWCKFEMRMQWQAHLRAHGVVVACRVAACERAVQALPALLISHLLLVHWQRHCFGRILRPSWASVCSRC